MCNDIVVYDMMNSLINCSEFILTNNKVLIFHLIYTDI